MEKSNWHIKIVYGCIRSFIEKLSSVHTSFIYERVTLTSYFIAIQLHWSKKCAALRNTLHVMYTLLQYAMQWPVQR